MVLHLVRALFLVVVLAITISFAFQAEVLKKDTQYVTAYIVIPAIAAFTLILGDMLWRRKRLHVLSGLFFGVLAGLVIAYVTTLIVDMVVQVSRMRDGMRRVTHIEEIVGMEGDIITTQTLFNYEFEGEGSDGKLRGKFVSSGLRPHFAPNAAYFGLERPLLEAMG